ncbi:hypothetical protein HPT28_09270 [Streptomyces sp. JJ38]|nr:hypothetical protein [Streptomyces sp. JJ38]
MKGANRSLWWAFFGLTVTMTLRLPAGRALDHLTGITDLSYLLKHLFGGVLSSAALLSFLRKAAGGHAASCRPRWQRLAVPTLTAAIMTSLFFAELQPYETRAIFQDPGARAALLAYTIVFLGYLSASLVVGVRVCWRWGRDSDDRPLVWGLRIIGIGLSIGVAYALTRITTLIAHMTGDGIFPGDLDDYLSTYLLMAALLLNVIGSSVPALSKVRIWRAQRRALLRLHDLWRDLTEATPSVRLHPLRSLFAERIDPRDVRGRLYRRTIEIRDATLALCDYAPLSVREQARHHVEAKGLFGAQAAVATEACWLTAARRSKLRGDPPCANTDTRLAGGGRDLRSEISALTQLSDAYRSELARSFAAVRDLTETRT